MKRSATRFVEQRLKLSLNERKGAVVAPVDELRFLSYRLREDGTLAVASHSLERLKEDIRQSTRRTRGMSVGPGDPRSEWTASGMMSGMVPSSEGWTSGFGDASVAMCSPRRIDRTPAGVLCLLWESRGLSMPALAEGLASSGHERRDEPGVVQPSTMSTYGGVGGRRGLHVPRPDICF